MAIPKKKPGTAATKMKKKGKAKAAPKTTTTKTPAKKKVAKKKSLDAHVEAGNLAMSRLAKWISNPTEAKFNAASDALWLAAELAGHTLSDA